MKKADQSRITRQRLIEAGRREFAETGYADTSLQEVVRRAEVTKGAFYHHFTSKKDLFLHVYENAKGELGRAAFVTHVDHQPFAPATHQPPRLNPMHEETNEEVWSLLIERCRRYIELHIDPQVRQIVLVDSRWVLEWTDLQRIESEHGVILLRADLRRATQRGILKPLPLHMLARIITGALNETSLLVVHAEDPGQALDEAMSVFVHLLSGLRAETTA